MTGLNGIPNRPRPQLDGRDGQGEPSGGFFGGGVMPDTDVREAWKRLIECMEPVDEYTAFESDLDAVDATITNPRFSPERVELLEAMKRAADARDWDTFVEVGVVLTEHDRTHGIGGDGE